MNVFLLSGMAASGSDEVTDVEVAADVVLLEQQAVMNNAGIFDGCNDGDTIAIREGFDSHGTVGCMV